MEFAEIKNNFDKMSKEQKEYFVFKYCLSFDNLNDCLDEIAKLDEENYNKYLKQIILATAIKSYNDKSIEIKNLFEDSQLNYKQILNKFKILTEELNLNNSLEISLLYTYLMWNGYFSKDKKLYYQIEKRVLMQGMYSYDIMNGNGVCLNFSEMLKDCLNECGYSSAILLNKIENKKELKRDYAPDIKRNNIKPGLIHKTKVALLKPITNKTGNHAFNLVEDNGKLYIYDVTNLLVLELKNKEYANIITGQGNFKLTPYLSYIFNIQNGENLINHLNTTTEFTTPYDRYNYIITAENCMQLFNKNKSLFDDYHDDINDDILKIVDTLSYYKENKKELLKTLR